MSEHSGAFRSPRFFRIAARLAALVFVLPSAFSARLYGEQQPNTQQEPKIAVQVKTVSVLATVHDKHGNLISNLTKDDFVLDEDGRPQTIDYFTRETNLPLHLGLLVDTSLSQRRVLDQERDASNSFLDHLLRPEKDVAFIINFDRDVTLEQDFTSSLPKLQAALKLLQSPEPTFSRGDDRPRGWGHRGGTLFYDAVYLASDELMSKQQGRKSLIILSDGVDRGSKETFEEAIETAQRADTVIYSILFFDEEAYGGGTRRYGAPRPRINDRPNGKAVLEELSEKTGGQLFQTSKKETIEKIYSEIEEQLRNQYSIGYTPGKEAEAGYHKIHLTTRQKDLKVRARDGYYGGP